MSTGKIALRILRACSDGPTWARSLQAVKPVVDQLIARGLLERVAPHGSRTRNMVATTEAGRAAIAKAERG